jgi:hypothetical protein
MTPCTWYIQSNLQRNQADKLSQACDNLGKPYKLFKLIPFDTKMPRLNAQRPFVLMGSTTLNRNAVKSRKYKKGIFFNPRTFKPEQYLKHYRDNFLNADMRIVQIKDLKDTDYELDTELFIRSNDDSKQVAGGTLFFSELLEIQKNSMTELWTAGDLFTQNSEICIARTKEINEEYRLFIVRGKVIAGSQYRPTIDPFVPIYIKEFAENMANSWTPHDICIMDICGSELGTKIIECNGFNGCGFYAADVEAVVSEISRYQEEYN